MHEAEHATRGCSAVRSAGAQQPLLTLNAFDDGYSDARWLVTLRGACAPPPSAAAAAVAAATGATAVAALPHVESLSPPGAVPLPSGWYSPGGAPHCALALRRHTVELEPGVAKSFFSLVALAPDGADAAAGCGCRDGRGCRRGGCRRSRPAV